MMRRWSICRGCSVSRKSVRWCRWRDEGFDKLCGTLVEYMDDVYADKHITFKVSAKGKGRIIRWIL